MAKFNSFFTICLAIFTVVFCFFVPLNKDDLFLPNSVNLDQLLKILGRNIRERLVCLSTTGFFTGLSFFWVFKLGFHLKNFCHNSVTMIKSLPPFISFLSVNALLQCPRQSLVKIDQPNPLDILGTKPWTLLEYLSYSLDQQPHLFSQQNF